MKPEQIFDLASARYDKIEAFFNRPLTSKQKYELKRNILQAHIKYPNMLDELEYIIQRRLNEQELRALINDQFYVIEKRLGKTLTEKQIRNILYEKSDHSLNEVDDLVKYLQRKYRDNYKRTRLIVNRLIEQLEQTYQEDTIESMPMEIFQSFSPTPSVQRSQSELQFFQNTNDLLKQLSNDVRQQQIIARQDSSLDSHTSEIFNRKSVSTMSSKPSQYSSIDEHAGLQSLLSSHEQDLSPDQENKSNKAFENVIRMIQPIADKEHIEELKIVTNAIDKFQRKSLKNGIISLSLKFYLLEFKRQTSSDSETISNLSLIYSGTDF